jgi:hypothetical protein
MGVLQATSEHELLEDGPIGVRAYHLVVLPEDLVDLVELGGAA